MILKRKRKVLNFDEIPFEELESQNNEDSNDLILPEWLFKLPVATKIERI